MPTHRQNIVEVKGGPSSRSLGARDDKTIKAAFSGCPTFEMKDDEVREQFQKLVLEGKVNDEGHTFGSHDRDYK